MEGDDKMDILNGHCDMYKEETCVTFRKAFPLFVLKGTRDLPVYISPTQGNTGLLMTLSP